MFIVGDVYSWQQLSAKCIKDLYLRWEKFSIGCEINHLCGLIDVQAVNCIASWGFRNFHAYSDDSDQTAQMCSLI